MLKWLFSGKNNQAPKKPPKAAKTTQPKTEQPKTTNIHSLNPDHERLLEQIRAIAADHPEQTTALLKKWLETQKR